MPSELLFGEIYFDQKKQEFSTIKSEENERTFITFVLAPLYKIFAHVLSKEKENLNDFLKNFDLQISYQTYQTL